MIELTRLNDSKFFLNAELVELVEGNPDTIIRLTNGKKFVVKDEVRTVVNAILLYKRSIFTNDHKKLDGWNVIQGQADDSK